MTNAADTILLMTDSCGVHRRQSLVASYALLFVAPVVSFLLSACTSTDGYNLDLRLQTDFQPVAEFLSVEIEVDGGGEDTAFARIDAPYVTPGSRVAFFSDLPYAEARRIDVRLLRADEQSLADASIVVEQKKDLVVTVSVTRDCLGVDCDSLAGVLQRCLQGKCVDARCVAGDEPYCEDANLACDETNCQPRSSCGAAICEHNVCFQDTQNHNCETGEYCSLDDGCLPLEMCEDVSDCTLAGSSLGCVRAYCQVGVDYCAYQRANDGAPPLGSACANAGGVCASGHCSLGPDTCTNGSLDGDETDLDCGGSCIGCSAGQMCSSGADCLAGLNCEAGGVCEAMATCTNGKMDAGETDVDCGGGCPGCALGEACMQNTDCAGTLICGAGDTCEMAPPTCPNMKKDGSETDVDCGGGSCATCALGKTCKADADCASAYCKSGSCAMPSCTDGVKNGTELSVDCGGSCPNYCADYSCAWQTKISQSQCNALLDLFNDTSGPSWKNRTRWLSTTDPCRWHGVTCSGSNVSRLVFKSNGLSGTLPSSLTALSGLRVFDFWNEDLGGPVPSWLNQFSNLTTLRLQALPMSGSYPANIGELSSLTSLTLRYLDTSFTVEIPKSYGQLAALRTMRLCADITSTYGGCKGTIHPEFASLSNLQTLDLSWSSSGGAIPPEIGQLTNLVTLDLSVGNYTGTLPPEIGQLTKLRTLELFWTQLNGPIPPAITGLSSLTTLSICPTRLSGTITADAATGVWLRSIATNDWPANDMCGTS